MLLPAPAGYLAGTTATVMGNLLAASASDAVRGISAAPTGRQVPGQAESANATAMESVTDPATTDAPDTAGNGENAPAATATEGISVEEAEV